MTTENKKSELAELYNKYLAARRDLLKARYDAAQTHLGNQEHWKNADFYSPNAAASPNVRRILKSRARYEVVENNPYLKGVVLSIANDFVGSGPKLQIIDERFSPEIRKRVQSKFAEWAKNVGLREKLWRLEFSKRVDGESFAIAFQNKRTKYPIKLDFYVIESDRVGGNLIDFKAPEKGYGEIDGVRFDEYEQPIEYFILDHHPGTSWPFPSMEMSKGLGSGKWVKAEFVLHWFRKDRGWLRGIPELAPSFPLCSLLRRYTLATVRNAEVSADFTVLLESQNPLSPTPFTDGHGNLITDEPFDVFPLEMGMCMILPRGYKPNKLDSVPIGSDFDDFVGAIIREIVRPLLVPYNLAVGSSKDSNMSSSVLDANLYKSAQNHERMHCEDNVLNKIFSLWWQEAVLQDGYLELPKSLRELDFPPENKWRWDNIGILHTDPSKVADYLTVMRNSGFMTDKDIQEIWFNRDIEDWRQEIAEDEEFRVEQMKKKAEVNNMYKKSGDGDNSSDSKKSSARAMNGSMKACRLRKKAKARMSL